jgi:hypothetical protein
MHKEDFYLKIRSNVEVPAGHGLNFHAKTLLAFGCASKNL